MLDLRNLSIRDATGRRTAANLTNAMDFTIKQIFRRPTCLLKDHYIPALYSFIQLQLQGITGTKDTDNNVVYLLLADGKPYVGRTTLHRKAQKSLPGVGPRWSEHVRELHQQINGKAGDRCRRRYRILQHQQSSACMNIIILDKADAASIAPREALAITRIRPRANGHELKNFDETLKKWRTREPKPRNRISEGDRKKRKEYELRNGLEHWGRENEEHARSLEQANVKNILSKYSTYMKRLEDEKEVRMHLSLNFADMYRMQQATTATIGPIYLYEKTSGMLFIKACSEQKLCSKISIDTMLNKLCKTLDFVFHWAALTTLLPTYQNKTRAFTILRNYLSTYQLYLSKEYIVKVNSFYNSSPIKRWYKKVVTMHGTHRPNWLMYVLGKIKVVTTHLPNWNLRLVNVQRTVKEHKWDLHAMVTERTRNASQKDETTDDLVRIPANSKSRFKLESEMSGKEQAKECNNLLRSLGINRDLVPKPVLSKEKDDEDYIMEDEIAHVVSNSPAELAADLYRCTTNRNNIITVEDKDPSVLWSMNNHRIMNFWFYTLMASPTRWRILSITTDDVLLKYRTTMNSILPKSLLGPHAFSASNIPYAYFTVKYKCFKNAMVKSCNHFTNGLPHAGNLEKTYSPHPTHTCPKESHSCLRNIMSFKKLPGRAAFKRVGRAFSYATREVLDGFGLHDLSKGKDTLLTSLKMQYPRNTTTEKPCGCVKCGSIMKYPTLYTADAGQAYEMVKQSRINRAFNFIFKAIRIKTKLKDPTVSVQHSTKAKARFGGCIRDKLYDRTVLFISKIENCMRGLVDLRIFQFGNLFLEQVSGIPIGGPVSGTVLEGVLSLDEHMFEQYQWPKFASTHGLGGKRKKWITMARYVDDIFIASRWLCPHCVEEIVTEIYKNTIIFDRECSELNYINGYATIKFLDLWAYMSWSNQFLALVNKNDLYSLSGLKSLLVKNRFPIAYGSTACLRNRLVCDFQARIAKFNQQSFTPNMFFLYLVMDFAELMRLGYGRLFLGSCWKKAASDLGTWEIGEAALERLKTIIRETRPVEPLQRARCCLPRSQGRQQALPSGSLTLSLQDLLPQEMGGAKGGKGGNNSGGGKGGKGGDQQWNNNGDWGSSSQNGYQSAPHWNQGGGRSWNQQNGPSWNQGATRGRPEQNAIMNGINRSINRAYEEREEQQGLEMLRSVVSGQPLTLTQPNLGLGLPAGRLQQTPQPGLMQQHGMVQQPLQGQQYMPLTMQQPGMGTPARGSHGTPSTPEELRGKPTDLTNVLGEAAGQMGAEFAEQIVVAKHLMTRLEKAATEAAGTKTTKPTQLEVDESIAGSRHTKQMEARFEKLEQRQDKQEEGMDRLLDRSKNHEQRIDNLSKGIDKINSQNCKILEAVTGLPQQQQQQLQQQHQQQHHRSSTRSGSAGSVAGSSRSVTPSSRQYQQHHQQQQLSPKSSLTRQQQQHDEEYQHNYHLHQRHGQRSDVKPFIEDGGYSARIAQWKDDNPHSRNWRRGEGELPPQPNKTERDAIIKWTSGCGYDNNALNEYDNPGDECSNCGAMGHHARQCPKVTRVPPPEDDKGPKKKKPRLPIHNDEGELVEDEDTRRELAELARIDAQHAYDGSSEGNARGSDHSTNEVFGHLPEVVRRPMGMVTEWNINGTQLREFASFCGVNGNKKWDVLKTKVDTSGYMMYTQIWEAFTKMKNFTQWQAKALGVGVRYSCVHETKNIGEIGRLVALRYMSLTQAEKTKFKITGPVFLSIEGKETTHWVTPELDAWFHETTDTEAAPPGAEAEA